MELKQQQRTRLRLFIVEAQSPMDLVQTRSESDALEQVCRLMRHEVARLPVRSRDELAQTVEYIAGIDLHHDEFESGDVPLFVHISAHGNNSGLRIGVDFVSWDELGDLLRPLCRLVHYQGALFLVISACGAHRQKVTQILTGYVKDKAPLRPPSYVFVTADAEPTWEAAVVSWAVFYHQIPKVNFDTKREVQGVLDRVQQVGAAAIGYWRWEHKERRYKRYGKPLEDE